MLLKVDHYTSLARAVARLDRDSYEARGAVYDRALTALVRRLNAVAPPLSQDDIDMELLAFREAVRRVEFGDLDYQEWVAQQQREQATQQREPAAPVPEIPQRDVPISPVIPPVVPLVPTVADVAIVAPPDPVAEPTADARALIHTRERRSVFGRVVGRAVLALLLIGVGIAGYAHAMGQLDLSSVTRLLDQLAAMEWPGQGSDGPRLMDSSATEPAAYYEQDGSAWKQLQGKALWRTRLEPAGAGRKTEPVLLLDVQVPERGLALAMSVRRDTSENAAMSHLIEFQFSGSEDFAIGGISGVTGINMKGAADRNGTALTGLSVRVAPGVFLFGLSPDREEMRRNIELLRTQSRLEIPIAFTNGRTGIVAIDKGESGERVVDEVLSKWAQ